MLGINTGLGRRNSGGPGVDPAATITSSSSVSVAENATLSHSLTANESVTWSIVAGGDGARFELSGSTLRWLSNGTKDYEAPNDANTDNVYVVTVRATDSGSNTTDQTISVTVTDVNDTINFDFTSAMPGAVTVTSSPAGYAKNSSSTLTSFTANAGRRTDLGILVEPAATNILPYSENIVNTSGTGWSTTSVVTGSSYTGIDGTTVTGKIDETATTNSHRRYRSVGTATGTWCFSVYVKAAERSAIALTLNYSSTSYGTYVFNVATGAMTKQQTTGSDITMVSSGSESLGSSWYRVWAVFTNITATTWNAFYQLATSTTPTIGGNGLVASYLGVASNGLQIMFPQVEAGTAPTSYIGTVSGAGSSVTRAADSISFTIPSGITSLLYTFSDDTTQSVSVSAGAYSIPTNLNKPQIKTIVGS